MTVTVERLGVPIKVTGTTNTDDEILDSSDAVFVKFIHWYKPTTVGHLLNVTDGDAREITMGYCDVANKSQFLPVYQKVSGLRIDDMDSGTVFIHTGPIQTRT